VEQAFSPGKVVKHLADLGGSILLLRPGCLLVLNAEEIPAYETGRNKSHGKINSCRSATPIYRGP
jgi:hypothetical protein